MNRPDAPERVRVRVALVAWLGVAAAGLGGQAAWRRARAPDRVVEVRGEVPKPGYYLVSAGATAGEALAAAGLDLRSDAAIPADRAIEVRGGAWAFAPLSDPLVLGLPLDLNTAGQAALEALPGVGPRRAAAIVAWRAAHGPFRSVDDLDRVPGFGADSVEALRPHLAVAPLPAASSR